MGKIFNRKPKCATEDFNRNKLPTTRTQVFFDVLRLHWRELVLCGFLMLLFCLPMHVVAVMEDITVMDLSERFGNETDEQIQISAYTIFVAQTNSAILKTVCFLIVGVAIAGFGRIIKRFSWEQSVHFSTDFAQGIKSNGIQMVILSLLVGLINLFAVFCYGNALLEQDAFLSTALMFPMIFALLVLLPVAGYMVVSISIYKNTFRHHLSLAFAVYSKNPFKTLLATLCCCAIFVIQFLPYFALHVAGRLVATFLSPFVFLGWYLFALNQFDEVVNKQKFPQLVGKGTIWPED